jgi:hypothetical protein
MQKAAGRGRLWRLLAGEAPPQADGAKGARSVRAQASAKAWRQGNVFGGMFNPAHHRRVLLGIVLTFS